MSSDELEELRASLEDIRALVTEQAERDSQFGLRLDLLETSHKVALARFDRADALHGQLQLEQRREQKVLALKMDRLLELVTQLTGGDA